MSKQTKVAKRSQGQRPGPSKKTAKKSQVVKAPVAQMRDCNKPSPTYKGIKNGILIKNSEFVTDVNCTNLVFGLINNIPIQPGLLTSFPWLAVVAQCWEKYRFRKLAYRYVTRQPTSIGGSLILAPEYDAADNPPTSEVVMCSYQNAKEGAIWRDHSIELDPASLHDRGEYKYIRTAALPPNRDIKTYDAGTFYTASAGTVLLGASFGKLWVDYEIELVIPTLPPEGVALGPLAFQADSPSLAFPMGTVAPQINGIPDQESIDLDVDLTTQRITFNDLTEGNIYSIVNAAGGTLLTGLGTWTNVANAGSIIQTDVINAAANSAIKSMQFTALGQYVTLALSAMTGTTLASNAFKIGPQAPF